MKELSLVINTEDLSLGEEEKKMSNQELFAAVINNVLLSYSKQINGLVKYEREYVYEIDQNIKKAIIDKINIIELRDSTVAFLRKSFKEVKLTPNSILKKIEENIDAIKDR